MTADVAPACEIQSAAKIFISYSRKDMAFADRIEAALKARGFEVLIDRDEIYAFEDWWKRLQVLIGGADTIVFMLSPDSVASHEVLREVEYAASLHKRFAPIVCRRVDDDTVPEALRRLNFIFLDVPAGFDLGVDRLAVALQTDIDWIRQHTQYGELARHWLAKDRPDGLLLRSPALEEAERWFVSRHQGTPEIPSDTQSFIAESRKGANRRRWRIQASAAIVAVLAIAGLAAWWNQAWLRVHVYLVTSVHPMTVKHEQALKAGDSFNECADCPEMVVVPAGGFTMGSPPGKGYDTERPQHAITIAKAFAVSKYELTFAEWDVCWAQGACPRAVDNGFGRGRQPLINVSWDEAKAYVEWLSRITGKTYRLLSEAEYEYAERAGSQAAYPWGNDIKLNGAVMADCSGCGSRWDGKQTAPVGSFPPNRFGLYDMAGNVHQWTEDCFHGNYNAAPVDGSAWTQSGNCFARIARGGSWFDFPAALQSSSRNMYATILRINYLGFRVARTLAP